MPLGEIDRPVSSKPSAERDAAAKLYSTIAVHAAEVMNLLPLLNRLARPETEQAPVANIERARKIDES
jgi:hypothetical protein